MKKAIAECPNCEHKITIGFHPKLGQFISCPACKTRLEVVWLDPVELDFPYEVEDDDIEDEFDFDEEEFDEEEFEEEEFEEEEFDEDLEFEDND